MSTSLLDGPVARIVDTLLRKRIGTRAAVLVAFTGGGVVNAVTGGVSEPAKLNHPVQTLPGESYLGTLGLDPGTLVERNQRAVLISGATHEPTTSHRMELDGREWSIQHVRPVSSGERNALYLLVLEVS